MIRPSTGFLLFLGLFGFGANTIDFDDQSTGSLPHDWTAAMTHTGRPPLWKVEPDSTAPSRPNVLAQLSAEGPRFRFPLAIFDQVVCRDGDISVKFKIVSGRDAKTVGLVWRFQDPNNYYLLHFSADEKNIIFFRVQNGTAHSIPVMGERPGALAIPRDIRLGQWYIARAVFHGSHIRVWFGNRKLFDAEDTAIPSAGKTGLMTKGGTVAYFDDFRLDKKG